ncbi:hypothetical protein Cst_c27680 [Thermoclostridium stercorarium subsp. stercorarium DSM 8532]|uniref:Uncharacterized protein n=1 Tax=Thermoclostridium stercorarium (strain ATCC 35414 / DSM 8532 / NCIMB 11754) TaxID=1121335 RepID=L7VTN7_THES1|nr:hypothetical protein Cst_c27680 [Thermoclostridium stercorarium subsp. stercorarium DSM 8532]
MYHKVITHKIKYDLSGSKISQTVISYYENKSLKSDKNLNTKKALRQITTRLS